MQIGEAILPGGERLHEPIAEKDAGKPQVAVVATCPGKIREGVGHTAELGERVALTVGAQEFFGLLRCEGGHSFGITI